MNIKKKYIFLDIDGVLATVRQFYLNPDAKTYLKKYNAYPFDDGCVKVFNDILKETNAEIILSSDWQVFYKPEEIDDIFKINGVDKKPIDYATPMVRKLSEDNIITRAYSINSYLISNPIDNYVIIDDLDIASLDTKSYDLNGDVAIDMDRFVHTSRGDFEGIKQTGVKEKVLKVLTS